MRLLTSAIIATAVVVALAPGLAGQKPDAVPVDFTASAVAQTALATATATLKIHIAAYTSDRDRTILLSALRTNGYQNFLPAFRRTPVVGYAQIKDQKWDLRWASQAVSGSTQTITAATDRPMFFIGGAETDQAKSRRGFEMAVIRLEVDSAGKGTGVLNAAARVKPNADATNVIVDDYAEEPVKLTSVTRQK